MSPASLIKRQRCDGGEEEKEEKAAEKEEKKRRSENYKTTKYVK